MAGAQIATSVTILQSGLKGFQGLSLTEYGTSAESSIAAGSVVEIGGAFFVFSSDEAVTGFSAITTATTAYLELTPSGTAGSQVVNAAWSADVPVWDDSKQGWYHSAGSVIRTIAGACKTGTSTSEPEFILRNTQNKQQSIVIEIGDWDMDSDNAVAATCTIPATSIVGVTGVVRSDDASDKYIVGYVEGGAISTAETSLWFINIDSSGIWVARLVNGFFDGNTDYNATSYNRGWITVTFELG